MICQKIFPPMLDISPGLEANQELALFTLTNDSGCEVSILTCGGAVTSVNVPDRDGQVGDVVLGFDQPGDYLGPHPYFGSLVGRCCNRIADGRFSLQGVSFQLTRNDGPHHLHGGLCGFDRKIWHARPLETGAGLELNTFSCDGEEGYPGNLQVRVVYRLTDDNCLGITYQAETDAPTVVNLTHHGYFNLGNTGDILDHWLMLPASTIVEVDASAIPTGEIRSIARTGLDFHRPQRIGAILGQNPELLRYGGLDHCFVLDRPGRELTLAAELFAPDTGRRMRVYTTEPALQVYTANYFDGSITGKSGRMYDRYAGICFEAQHFPDSPNQPSFPTITLQPGDIYSQTTIYQFDVQEEG
jgi:aldose 1-epimerase